jgi:hypothetical protein
MLNPMRKKIEVSGQIKEYKGKPEIILKSLRQINIIYSVNYYFP